MAKKPSDTKSAFRNKLDTGVVAKALAKNSQAIDSGQLLNALIQQWGGPQRFAQDIFAEYQNAGPGTLARQRILEMLTRLTVQVTSQEVAKPRQVSDMTIDELLSAAQHLMEKLNGPARPSAPAQAS